MDWFTWAMCSIPVLMLIALIGSELLTPMRKTPAQFKKALEDAGVMSKTERPRATLRVIK